MIILEFVFHGPGPSRSWACSGLVRAGTMTVRIHVGFIFRLLQGAGPSADIQKMEIDQKPCLSDPAAAPSREIFAWCLLAVWMIASAAVLYQHMDDNPPGLCRTGGAAMR